MLPHLPPQPMQDNLTLHVCVQCFLYDRRLASKVNTAKHTAHCTYPSLGLLANGTLENVDLYRQLGELLGQNRTKIELKIESK